MKIDINKVSLTPKNIGATCCVFTPTEEVLQWISVNNVDFETHPKGYLNIYIKDLAEKYKELFNINKKHVYFDGFSPNLNKELHLGHLSNLIYASAISNLCNYLKPVAILNDIDNHIKSYYFLEQYKKICKTFNYKITDIYFASEMKYKSDSIKKINLGDFKGCKSISTKHGEKILVKSNDSTSYLYQDLGFAQKLDKPILYLTGSEQISHFELVTEFYPKNKHLAIGLIKTNEEKMSSRLGNVIYIKDLLKKYSINEMKDTLLSYNYSTSKNEVEIKEGLSKSFKGVSNHFENEKLYIVYLKSIELINPSLLYNKLKGESKNDIDFGLKLLGYENK